MRVLHSFIFLSLFPIFRARFTDQLEDLDERQKTIWQRILWRASNETGQISRDRLMESSFKKMINDGIKPRIIEGQPILGTQFDPVWLFPIGPIELKKRRLFKGQLTACNLYLHNLKAMQLYSIEIQRNEALSSFSVKVISRVPIVWMTGKYMVRRALLFGFIPSGSQGSFNIDLKNVIVGAIASLKVSNGTVNIDQFEVGFRWTDSTIKFDTGKRHLDKISDLLLNKLDIGDIILRKQRVKIIEEIEKYFNGLFNCLIHQPYIGPIACMEQWWRDQGWDYPWVYPTCD